MKRKMPGKEKLFQACMLLLFSLLFLLCFYPFYYIFITSISDPAEAQRTTIGLFPVQVTLRNYREVFRLNGIWRSFGVSAARTAAGTAVTLLFTSLPAYTLTKKELPCRKFFYRFAIVSMYINAGLIPWYLTMRSLGLKNTFLVYLLPTAVSAYSLVLIKTYMESVSSSLEESAMMDGAGYFTIYLKIMMPLCLPVLAAVIVFTAVGQWNMWTDNLLLVNKSSLKTLQLTLLEYLNQATNIANEARNGGFAAAGGTAITPFSVRMTITMVVTLPILLIYPFMQKYFIQGIMIGAVKG